MKRTILLFVLLLPKNCLTALSVQGFEELAAAALPSPPPLPDPTLAYPCYEECGPNRCTFETSILETLQLHLAEEHKALRYPKEKQTTCLMCKQKPIFYSLHPGVCLPISRDTKTPEDANRSVICLYFRTLQQMKSIDQVPK